MQPDILSPTNELFHRAAAIRAVQGAAMNVFSAALESLQRVSERLNSPIAIVGGLAGILHQAVVTTLDIDVVVDRDRLDDFVRECEADGMEVRQRSEHGWHKLTFRHESESVSIEVIPEGEKSPRDPDFAPPTPGPQELGVAQGLGYANFAGWVAMKLVANRDKDRYHLVEALKKASLGQTAEAVVKLRTMHPSYLREFERLMRAAEDENQENW
jgi:hypothetical protein